jgi:hypothetical protein
MKIGGHGHALGRLRPIKAGATAAAASKASLNGSEVVHKSEQALSCSKPMAERAALGTASVSGAEQPPVSTKRAKLIGLLERSEGASVAESGSGLVGCLIRCGPPSPACAKPVRSYAEQGCR